MYNDVALPLSTKIRSAHNEGWQVISESGAFWTGRERVAMVIEARAAQECTLCRERLSALSPYAIQGRHDSVTDLPTGLIELIHRLITDPQRITKRLFDETIDSGISAAEYVEAISVVCSSVIVDSTHKALDIDCPHLPDGSTEPPRKQQAEETVDAGAWVRLPPADGSMTPLGIPRVANIVRSMGLVPAAVDLFFRVFRAHYLLLDIPLKIQRAQAEFIAARVSALNECFY